MRLGENMVFIKVSDVLTGKYMLIRADKIIRVEESECTSTKCRKIIFEDGTCEYVYESLDELIEVLSEEDT